MAADAVYDAIVAFLQTSPVTSALTAANNGTAVPIRYENMSGFQPPDPPTAWIAMALTGVLYGQESLGASVQANNRWDEDGHLWLPVFVAQGSGASLPRKIAKVMADQFRGLTLLSGALEFRDAHIGEGGTANETGNWYELPLAIEWRRVDA